MAGLWRVSYLVASLGPDAVFGRGAARVGPRGGGAARSGHARTDVFPFNRALFVFHRCVESAPDRSGRSVTRRWRKSALVARTSLCARQQPWSAVVKTRSRAECGPSPGPVV